MNEIERIYQTFLKWKSVEKRMALVTVVSIQGSAYRNVGARMLISENGQSEGMIGGGCFDADVREIGFQVIRTGKPELHLYQMAGADPWGLGMGCTGSVYVLIESLLHPAAIECIKEIESALQQGSLLFIAHHFSKPLDYSSSDCNGEVHISRHYRHFPADQRGREVSKTDIGTNTFLEWIEPAPRLIVFGAGNDAIPVVHYTAQAGFRVTVVDQRQDLLQHERFPKAAGFIHAWPGDYEKKITPSQGDYVLMMSHRLENDAEAFRVYSTTKLSYIGFLGPRSRTERILHEIVKTDPVTLAAIREILHAPIGLDLGAETAEEVAISIVAELMAVKNRRIPHFLREKKGNIHGDRNKYSYAMTSPITIAAAGPNRSCGI